MQLLITENANEDKNPAHVLFGLILGQSFLPLIMLPNIYAEESLAHTIVNNQKMITLPSK